MTTQHGASYLTFAIHRMVGRPRPRMMALASIVLLSLLAVSATAETVVEDDIETDTTWTRAGSPYILDAHGPRRDGLDVGHDERPVTLTIEAGVVVVFRGSPRLEINQKAALIVKGTRALPVTFRPNDTDDEYYVEFNDHCRASDSSVTSVIFERGGREHEPTVQVSEEGNGTISFQNCQFLQGRGVGLHNTLAGPSVLVDGCLFDGNAKGGIVLWNRLSHTIGQTDIVRNCRFQNQDWPAVRGNGYIPAVYGNTGDNKAYVQIRPTGAPTPSV